MSYVPAELRRRVIERAGGCCEYCRIRIEDRLLPLEVDHIIAEKHGGATTSDNLCVACFRCNGFKGSDIASADPETGAATFLYNPRQHNWEQHFQLNDAVIDPLTAEGRVTVRLLRFNMAIHIAQRIALINEGLYPCQPTE